MRRSEQEIQDQIAAAEDSVATGESRWPGMSYEDGVSAALRWCIGESDDVPMEDE